jgi:hypothetical protein
MRCCFDILITTCYCKFVYLIVASLEGGSVFHTSQHRRDCCLTVIKFAKYDFAGSNWSVFL